MYQALHFVLRVMRWQAIQRWTLLVPNLIGLLMLIRVRDQKPRRTMAVSYAPLTVPTKLMTMSTMRTRLMAVTAIPLTDLAW